MEVFGYILFSILLVAVVLFAVVQVKGIVINIIERKKAKKEKPLDTIEERKE